MNTPVSQRVRNSEVLQYSYFFTSFSIHTLVFLVEPPNLLPVFSIDRATGLLVVDGSGPSLKPDGISNGYVNVSFLYGH